MIASQVLYYNKQSVIITEKGGLMFTHLHYHSMYSVLDGYGTPEQIFFINLLTVFIIGYNMNYHLIRSIE
jgi:hypothetical protein